jgi:hypothetical protein
MLGLLVLGSMQLMGLGFTEEAENTSAAGTEITRYLGPPNDPASLTLAEQGQLDAYPGLVPHRLVPRLPADQAGSGRVGQRIRGPDQVRPARCGSR